MTKPSAARFAQLLTEAILRVRLRENKNIQIVQDELGYVLGRQGGSAIEYWRKGHIPQRRDEVELLARELVRRGGLDQGWLEQFLSATAHGGAAELCAQLFPANASPPAAALPEPAAVVVSTTPAPDEQAPFIVGPPILEPRNFFGRAYELKRIFDLWKRQPLQNVALIGHKRSGKTSLLHYLQRITSTPASALRGTQRRDWLPQPERYSWVFVDFQDARMCQRGRLLRYLLSSLSLPIPEPCDLSAFLDVVSQQLSRPAIILMDQIGAALASPELDQQFWWSLRSLGSHQTRGMLGFVLTSQEPPAELALAYNKPSPFFNIFGHTFRLGPLQELEARELMDSSPLPFPEDDQRWMLEQSQCWPCLLQILCYNRLMALRDGEQDDAWRERGLDQSQPFRHLLESL